MDIPIFETLLHAFMYNLKGQAWCMGASDVNKDLNHKAKAKDSGHKAKAKDLGHKAKAKDLTILTTQGQWPEISP